jgi:hypothetical protein
VCFDIVHQMNKVKEEINSVQNENFIVFYRFIFLSF